MNLKEGAGKLKSPALAMALKDAGTPTAAKTLAGITVAYALSPIDLILDFVPVLGHLDDAPLLPLLVVATVKIIPVQVFEQCSKKAEGMWENAKAKAMVLRPSGVVLRCLSRQAASSRKCMATTMEFCTQQTYARMGVLGYPVCYLCSETACSSAFQDTGGRVQRWQEAHGRLSRRGL